MQKKESELLYSLTVANDLDGMKAGGRKLLIRKGGGQCYGCPNELDVLHGIFWCPTIKMPFCYECIVVNEPKSHYKTFDKHYRHEDIRVDEIKREVIENGKT